MPVTVELMTARACAFCPAAHEVVKKVCKGFGRKVRFVERSIDTPAGRARALALGVRAVPTILIDNEPKFTGVPRPVWLRAAIRHFLAEERAHRAAWRGRERWAAKLKGRI